jgi:hypothetical protein
MNCDVVQRLVLGCESPDRPSADAAAHLADCAACREWLVRLLQMERAVPYLPVPPAEAARSALMRRILSRAPGKKKEPVAEKHRPSIAMVVGSWIMDPHASPRRRVAAGLVAGVAAALLLFITGWLIWDGDQHDSATQARATPARIPADKLVADLHRFGIHEPEGKVGPERVTAMAAAAEVLRTRAAERSGADDELVALAQLYSRVVEEGVVKTAEGLSAADRRAILGSIAADLYRADSEWHRLSQQTGLAPAAKDALAKAALAAHNGHARLRELCNA